MRQVDMLVGVSGRRNEKKRGMGRYLFGFSSLALMLGACESGGVVKSLALPDNQAPVLASVAFDARSTGGNALVLTFKDNSNIKLTETDTEKILEKLFIRLKSKDGEGGERVLVSSDIVSIKTVNKQLRIEIDPSKFQYKEGDIFTVDIKPGLVTDDSNNQLEVPSGGLKTEEVVAPDVPPLFVGADAGVLDLASGGTELKWEEGKTRVGDFGARDPNGDVVSYSLGGRDAALFKIDEAGVLSFRSLPALKGDSDGDGVYEVDISAKGGDLTTLHRLTVNVGKDEPILNPNVPTWSSSTENVSVAENETAVSYTAMASDADGDTLTYSLGGADSGKFDINTATGVLTFKNAPDFEATTKSADGNNAYEVTLTANDGKGGLNGLMLTVNVKDVDETIPNNVPSWSGTTETVSVAENETAVVYTTVASDADSDTLMYSVSGDESGLFSIEASTGVLRFKDAPDYENALDAGSDNGYEVTVTVDDGRGGTDTLSLMVNVSDVNESPSWRRSTETVSVDENDVAVVYTSRASDVDAGDTLMYSVSGADSGKFNINTATGVLTFKSGPDFEATTKSADGNNAYEVEVTASDGKGGTDTLALTVNVENVNEATTWDQPTEVFTVDENTTAVAYTSRASDVDADALMYSLGGADAGKFDINANTGVLTFKNGPDFEARGSAAGDNGYKVTVTADDGGGSMDTLTLTVQVSDVDETVPNNAPSWSGTTETVSVAENETAVVYTTVASDADSDTLMYSVSGDESGLFSIEASTGVLRFKDAPDYENALDAGRDNGYEVTVTVSDGRGGTDTLSLMVNVTDENESPSWRRSTETVSVDENETAVAYTSRASDVDVGDTLMYSVSGVDAGKFNIDENTGVLTFKSGPDFETKGSADGNNAYKVTVVASDGGGEMDALSLTVNVTNVDEGVLSFTGGSATVNVMENATAVGTYTASDPDGGVVMYSVSGTDAAYFSIDGNTGSLTFTSAPNYEDAKDDGGNNVYDVQVVATVGVEMVSQAVAVSVTDVNEVPSWDRASEAVSADENQTAVAYTTMASDVDTGDMLEYSLTGADAGKFNINTATGVLTFKNAPDFEAKGSADGDNVYEVTVTVSDGRGGTDTLSLMVNVTDENESPSWRRSTETVSVDENDVAVVYTSRASDVDAGDTLMYSLGGADAGKFDINTATGVLTFKTPPDYEALTATQKANGLSVTVTADDGNGGESDLMLSVKVTDENEAPVFAAGLATEVTFAEGTGTDVTIFTAMASDEDDGDSVTYSVTGTVFTIDATTGALSFMNEPDYETLTAGEKTNGLSVTITAEDGGGLTAEHELKVRVTDVVENRAPAFAGGLMTSVDVMENTTAVGTFVASDPEGGAVMYALSGDDAALFEINGAGVLTFMSAPDYERLSQSQKDNGYKVTVTASDDGGLMDAHALTVNVTNVNDNSPVFSGGLMTSVSVMENSTAVGTFAASDDDGDTLMYTLSGDDAALFEINGAGVLTFMSAPDYERLSQSQKDNGYKVTVTASDDGGLMDAHALTVNVTNVDEGSLMFEGNPSSSVNVLENTKAVATFMASDTAGSVVMYSLKGEDASFFVINANTGVLSLGLGLDYENAVDEDGDNIYDVTVVASVAGSADETEHSLSVSVTDNTSEYVFGFDASGPSSKTVKEGYTGVLGTFHAPVFSSITYSLAGKDAHAFTLNDRLGNRELKLNSKIDYEYPTDAGGNNVYEVFVVATSKKFGSDAQVVAWHKFTATVTDAAESLKFKGSLLNTVSVDENTTFVGEFTAHDDGRTRDTEYSLEGDDAGLFSVDMGPNRFTFGAVTFKSAPDYEDAKDVGGDNIYNVTIKAVVSKGGVTKTVFHDLEVKVANVNDNAPVFSGLLDEVAIDEETTLVGTFAASDLDDDSFMYGVKGADAALFEIDGAGALSFKVAPDYETLSQSRKDNGFSVTIEATTGAGVSAETVEHALMVSVTDTVENRAPIFSAGLMTSVDVMENTTSVGTFVASDPDGDAVMYSVGGVDAGFFMVDGNTGSLTFTSAPDYEMAGDAGGNNVYDVTITASDVGGEMDDHVLMVNVTDVVENRAPVFSAGLMTSVDVAEDSATLVGTFAASDPDGDAVMYSVGGVDAGFFMVDGNGVLSFKNAPDFEMKQDDGGNNVYDVTVTASDVGGLMDDHVLMVNVTDVVENRAPIFSAGLMTSVSVMEGVTSVGTFAASDPDGDALMYVLSGVDSALFDINGATGVLTFKSDPDFEDAKDVGGNNVYDVTITASDGDGLMDTHALMVSVTNEPWDAVAENYGKKSGYDSKISDLIIVDLGSSGWNPLLVVDDPRSWIKIVSGGSTYTGNAAVDLNFISADKLYIYTDPGILKKGSATLTIKKAALTKSGGVNEPADKVIDFTVGDAINQDGVPAPVFVSLNYDDTLGPSLLSGIHVQFNRALHADIDKSKITVHVEFKTTSGSSFRVDSSQKTYPLAVDMGGDAPYVEGIFLTLPIPLQFLTNPPDFYQSRVRVEFKSGAVKNGAGGNTAVFTDWEVVPTSAPSIEDDGVDLGLSVGDRDDDEGLDLVGLSAYDDFSF